MRRTNKIKTCLVHILAVAMVITMTAPPASVYALSYGDPAVIWFDPREGPDLSRSSYMNIPRDRNRTIYATGRVGRPLAEASDFNGIAVENPGPGDGSMSPAFDMDLGWPEYTFDGWYSADSNKILYLLFAFLYSSTTTYGMRWNGDASSQFDFTVMHYRDLNKDRNGNMNGGDPSAWSEANNNQIYKFLNDGGWITRVTANITISAAYKRGILGHKVSSVIAKNSKTRRFGDTSGYGTLGEAATINESTRSICGNMLSNDLTVAYRYELDSSRRFALCIEYVNGSGCTIRTLESYLYLVEPQVSAAPA